jgi:chromosome segregation protein
MRLSRLHIAGFKSFPDRAELGFDDGVTAIVGPNGCGKSNVVDAITWVLGEQSAKSLRGDRMEDVIFNGSDARKPTAAAEVRLKLTRVAQAAMTAATAIADPILDAEPLVTRDIEIGRRLYRSGESEYLIDGEVCRLRDVHDLLMDSGLGVKAYAVIEQGKIGQILASRPAERRALIEEAAGVTKYKSRRRAAELKLEAAQQNLTRVDDIIFEVEKQRGALKRQAARARRYKRLREELRRWEQVQFAHRHAALAAEIDAADRRLADARVREAGAAARVADVETAIEALRLELTVAEAGATAAREAAHTFELEIGRREQQIRFEHQQIDDLGRQAAAFLDEVRELDGRRGPALAQAAAQRQALDAARASLAQAAARVSSEEAQYAAALTEVQTAEQDADATRAAVLASSTTLSALQQARDHAAAGRDRVAAERERLDIEARELDAEAERAAAEQSAARGALEAARAALDAARAERADAERRFAERRAARDTIGPQLAARERTVAASEARLRSLEEIESRRATFGDAARVLLAEGQTAVQHRGAVADHLVVERSFERAVDALLGDVLQYVLVETIGDVRAGLALLSDRDAGRCGFVVLDAAGTGNGPSEPLVVPPGARALTSVVRPTGSHASAIAPLLGRALIVETFDTARALAATLSVPVAATTGEVVQGGWLVQGGARQDVRGILETRAEVLSLRESVADAAADVDRLQRELRAADADIAAAEDALTAVVRAQHDREKEIVSLEARDTRAAEERHRLSRRLDVVRLEHRRASEEMASAEQRRDAASAAIIQHEHARRAAEDRLADTQARLQQARDAAEARLRHVTGARTDQATLGERVTALDADAARLDEAARDLDARIAGRTADMQRAETRRDEFRESIRAAERALDAAIAGLDARKTDMRTLDERVAGLRQAFAARDQELRAGRQALEAVRNDVLQAEVGRARAASDLAHLGDACVEATGATLVEVAAAVAEMEARGELSAPGSRLAAASAADDDEEAPSEVSPAEPEALLTPDDIIATLKRKIDRLGPVNMMAIEQFDELESRHTFLTSQRQDLLDSISQTGEAIRKIDKTTRERFEEAFASINQHFQTTFTTLFGGGRAGLVLIDADNDSESGIDIIAQPPGKRLQNVQLLSGGEKALTAMALMFAIFKHRPSPFCLLDEIDAPLDDANIGRFVEMLQGMQMHTQFILITHNRKTMEIADRLYGVTMEEPGVSKLISVSLN